MSKNSYFKKAIKELDKAAKRLSLSKQEYNGCRLAIEEMERK